MLCGDHLFQSENNKGETISNVLFVQFYSDNELTASGFELSYGHLEGACAIMAIVC